VLQFRLQQHQYLSSALALNSRKRFQANKPVKLNAIGLVGKPTGPIHFYVRMIRS